MRGKVLAVASPTGPGFISGDDGRRYAFGLQDLRNNVPRAGQEVDFDTNADFAGNIYVVAGSGTQDRDWMNFYTSPNGRITRRDYWLLAFLPMFGISLVLGWIPIVGQIVQLAMFWPSIATQVKRLHDRDYSGWWILMPMIPAVPFIVFLIAGIANADSSSAPFLYVVAGFFGLIFFGAFLFIIFGILARSGQVGPNRFGQDPRPGGV